MTLAMITAALLMVTGIAAPAQGQDNIGLYWDNNYTEFSTTTESIPEILTGHLVLKDPSTTSGLSGWECCAEADGPGQFISWVFEGQATNFTSSPCFRVGISGPPLPSQADVLLATFEIMVTEFQAVTLSLRPDYVPSVPGQMSFYLADDPATPLPMTTTSGLPDVAWVNGGNGWIIDPGDGLDFGQYWVNGIKELSVTIENTGDLPLPVFPSVADSCPAFYPLTGSFSIDPGAFGTVVVGFSPLEAIEYDCLLDLGLVLPDIPLMGTGSDSTAWTAPTYHDFGNVGVGLTGQYFTFDISNTGSMGFWVSASLPDTTQSFFRPPVSFFLNPGQTQTTSVWFKPVVPGHHSVMLDLGEILPPVLLEGDGDPRPMGFSVVPDTVDFGWHFLGDTEYEALFIYNTGGTFLDLGVYLAHPELGFSITRGYGSFLLPPGDEYLVHILYQPEELGVVSTDLNLGPMLPPAFIKGAAESHEDICTGLPDSLVFGPINAGGSQTLSYSVTNSSHQSVSFSPFTHNSPIFLTDGLTTIGPGQTQTLEVTFLPQLPLNYTGTLTVPISPLSGPQPHPREPARTWWGFSLIRVTRSSTPRRSSTTSSWRLIWLCSIPRKPVGWVRGSWPSASKVMPSGWAGISKASTST